MEESKELQGFYKIFRAVIYISVLMEFFEYAIDPSPMGSIVSDLHSRIKQWMIYQDGNMAYSKIATFLLVCITCVGTRNKKHLEFDARKQVLYPLVSGVGFIVLSVWLFNTPMEMRVYIFSLNTLLYMGTSIIGVVLVHIALDNISKFLKEGLLKDRFNFENESFEQCKDLQTNDCWYWTSTEVKGQQTAKAWLYSLGSGAMQETPKIQAHRARPIITLND